MPAGKIFSCAAAVVVGKPYFVNELYGTTSNVIIDIKLLSQIWGDFVFHSVFLIFSSSFFRIEEGGVKKRFISLFICNNEINI